eukprot:TRINITY_DN61374_c0_g1_i1.p1 TRINITY_DN61374_c0_g1~~TRINITY_DN61374_c0_g1_i1.p1  ORF type:complete len:649 (-),score=96.69 TRINITY_DN61374_c0_g1_i1:131-2077(-)
MVNDMLRLLALLSTASRSTAQSQYFEVLEYRGPSQCTRCQCLNLNAEICREHRAGFSLREKGCRNGKICTNCVYGNGSQPTTCECENPPFSIPAKYNEACSMGKECGEGEGVCFRPCGTFLHLTSCPTDYCQWDTSTLECVEKQASMPTVFWTDTVSGATPAQVGALVVQNTEPAIAYFPMGYPEFRKSSQGFRIQGRLIENITEPESLFLQLDANIDGQLSSREFAALPDLLQKFDRAVTAEKVIEKRKAEAEALAMAQQHEESPERRLQVADGVSIAREQVTPEVCNARKPRQYFCSFDVDCKLDCQACGWKSATDRAFSICVQPSPDVCHADGGKIYCASDERCHPPGDCSNCVDRTVVDHAQHACLALWWDPTPLPQWTNWVCRHRNKVGMPCQFDQDCIYGMRRCLDGACMPFQPYNANQTCVNDFDCPHLGFYCPSDPTGGQNPYWVQYCRKQRSEGMPCDEDRECEPDMRCNTGEPQPRCRKLFSLDIGAPAARDEFCQFGWRDRDGKCAPPAKSKQAGRPCDTDLDCQTNDETGRTGSCTCKAWWDKDDSKFCMPVAGDYARHQEALRNFLWFKATKCGSFWTEEECLRIFGNEAKALKLEVECETQTLSGGPYLPPVECEIVDNERFGDKCALLQEAKR